MTRLARAVGVALVSIVALTGCGGTQQPLSRAEAEQLYLIQMQLHHVHLPGTDLPIPDATALKLGSQVCVALRNPIITAEMVGATLTDSGDISAKDAGAIVGAAAGNLCPDVRDKVA